MLKNNVDYLQDILHGGFVAVAEESGNITVGIIETLTSGEIAFKEKQSCVSFS